MGVSPTTVFRVRGLPSKVSVEDIRGIIERSLGLSSEVSGLSIGSLAEDFYQPAEQVATLSFLKVLPEKFTSVTATSSNEWAIDLSSADYDSTASRSRTLKFDTHFRGLTALNDPLNHEEAMDCVVVCGLGGHAFGSFKEKGASYMWLRDTLSKDLPNLRVLLYGYDSGLDGSESILNVSTIAETFIGHLRGLRSVTQTLSRPLIMIAHSLGGLIVKQAIIKLSRGDESDKKQMQSIMGLVFFGVPNRGMDIASLRAMVDDQPNRYILESIGQYSDLLLEQDVRFELDFHYRDSPIFSFFETKISPTAVKVDGVWRMAGERKLLVGPFSARKPRPWEPESHHESLDRTHIDLVKFSAGDIDYERVHSSLREIVSKAKETLISRYLKQESPSQLSAEEKACLRTLSFTQMNAREGRVESAAPDTGDWLLKSQSFKDWAERKNFHQHHGLFWLQGKPGSGKSTLMKKAYLRIQSLSQDPTSIVARFFFNARGDEMEKSLAGLFRTLLHDLCQQISALRAVVMKQYHRKRELLATGWEWQIFELKELLSSAVTASVLGKRNLILCVDALDECDLIGAKSVIQFFEHLADCSIREQTKFNVCLSSRHWPQFTIRHCFKVTVERGNHADIASYIQQHMMTIQAPEAQSDHLATLETKLENKARGTFLWVVLVVQEILSAHENGATLGELDEILHRIPSDLLEFYQYQIHSTRHDDSCETLSIFQCIFYSPEILTVTKLRYLLAFGRESFSSYSEWAQSKNCVMNDTQLEKRIRDKSKGLVEMIEVPVDLEEFPPVRKSVQFIHQTVRDFLLNDGFKTLRGCNISNDAASGYEFLKVACFNYLNTIDLQSIAIDLRFYSIEAVERKLSKLSKNHPLLMYAVEYLFPYAALAEKNGISQDILRSHMSDNIQDSFERWKYLNDLFSISSCENEPCVAGGWMERAMQGPEARPLHIFAHYGLLVPGMERPGEDPNIWGGQYGYPLLAAAAEGHENAVRYLLNLGADLQVSRTNGNTAYRWAAYRGNVKVLKMILGHPRSVITLEQRILSASVVKNSHPQAKETIASLIPESLIPESAIDPICQLFSGRISTPELHSLVLDKCEAALLQHKRLLYTCVENRSVGLRIIQRLLNALGSVEVCQELVDALNSRSSVDRGNINTEKVAMILIDHFDHCDATMINNLVNLVLLLSNSSQLLNRLMKKGFEIPPLHSNQIMSALSNGSPESVSFFIQHAPDDAKPDDMLLAVLQNHRCAAQAVRILLGIRNIDRVCDDVMTSCLQKRCCNLSVLKTFEDRWGTMTFSRNNLAGMISSERWYEVDELEFVTSRSDRFSLTENIVGRALNRSHSAEIVNLLLEFDPNFRLQDGLIVKIAAEFCGHRILEVYAHHGKPLALTEEVVRAAACEREGVKALDVIFRHDSDANISDTMILEALNSPYCEKLITWMLESDPHICMQEDLLIKIASHDENGALMFEALNYNGRISIPSPYVGASSPPPAKRQRVSSNPLPPPRDKGTKSAPITTRVIEAAARNENPHQRRKLLSLFQKWRVLTDEDVELFHFSDEDDAASGSMNKFHELFCQKLTSLPLHSLRSSYIKARPWRSLMSS